MRHLSAIALLCVCLGWSAEGRAHDWYPISCCSGHDCHPVETDQLVEQADGSWVYLPTGTVFAKDKVFPSQDNKFHVCIGNYEFNKGKPLCAFVLQGS